MLDPAHGGTDAGARGEGGVTEKEIVLQLARTVRANLERQGYRVILTRNDDSNPSYDDRAAIANGYHDAIFISLHVSSTGPPGTARAYYQRFSTQAASSAGVLISWDDAQRNFVGASEHFADLVEHELAQLFSGSPVSASAASVRALRSVAGPAIAIEISSISGSSQDALASSATPVGAAILRAVVALRQTNVAAK